MSMRSSITLGIIACVALGLVGCTASYTGTARTTTPGAVPATWLRAAPTPVVLQRHETDCGLAALAMVAGRWGKQWKIDDMAREAPPDKTGVRLGALRDLARKRGLEAYVIRGRHEDIVFELGQGRPVLIGLTLPFGKRYVRQHYEVAIAVDPKTGTLVTLDPATGNMMQRTRASLLGEWKPEFPALVVVGELAQASLLEVSPKEE